MKKYVSLVLCALCFVGVFLLNYEVPLFGRGKGKSETVKDVGDLSAVVDSVAAMMNTKLSFDPEDAVRSVNAAHTSVTYTTEYDQSGTVRFGSDISEFEISGEETWAIDLGGKRMFVACVGDVRTRSDEVDATLYVDCELYYEEERGWFIKYNDIRIPGELVPTQILDRWISIESCDDVMDASKLCDQILERSYSFFNALGVQLSEERGNAFDRQDDLYIMKSGVFRNFMIEQYQKNPDMAQFGAEYVELFDIDGNLEADLSNEKKPSVTFSADMRYAAQIDETDAEYEISYRQKMTFTDIDNTVVKMLKKSKIYNLEDLLD